MAVSIVLAVRVTAIAMAAVEAPVRHTGAGVARRAAHHERQRSELALVEAETGQGELLPADDADVVLVPAGTLLEGVAEIGAIISGPKWQRAHETDLHFRYIIGTSG